MIHPPNNIISAGAPLRGTRAAGTRSGRRATRDLVNGVNGECRDGPCWYNQQSQLTYLNAVSIALINQQSSHVDHIM